MYDDLFQNICIFHSSVGFHFAQKETQAKKEASAEQLRNARTKTDDRDAHRVATSGTGECQHEFRLQLSSKYSVL